MTRAGAEEVWFQEQHRHPPPKPAVEGLGRANSVYRLAAKPSSADLGFLKFPDPQGREGQECI